MAKFSKCPIKVPARHAQLRKMVMLWKVNIRMDDVNDECEGGEKCACVSSITFQMMMKALPCCCYCTPAVAISALDDCRCLIKDEILSIFCLLLPLLCFVFFFSYQTPSHLSFFSSYFFFLFHHKLTHFLLC